MAVQSKLSGSYAIKLENPDLRIRLFLARKFHAYYRVSNASGRRFRIDNGARCAPSGRQSDHHAVLKVLRIGHGNSDGSARGSTSQTRI